MTKHEESIQDQPMARSDWTLRGLSQPLPDSEIHVWCASLECPPQGLAELLSLLSADEKARADQFYFERDRSRFIVGRGLLRILLSRYMETESSQIEFVYGDHGKPALKSESMDKLFEFNLSHSSGLALYIFNSHHRVGIDIENVRSLPDMDNFAEIFFSPHECASIYSLAGEQKEAMFFKIWTCKEAYLKANGNGLTIPINQMETSLGMEGSASIEVIGQDSREAVCWHRESFSPVQGYQAALAIEGYAGQVIVQQHVNNSITRR